MTRYYLSHDMGTSGNKAAVVRLDEEGTHLLSTAKSPYNVIYPENIQGGAEQDPRLWWEAIRDSTKKAVNKAKQVDSNFSEEKINAVSHSTQMIGALPVDENCEPLMNCLIWMDGRAVDIAKKFANADSMAWILAHLRTVLKFLRVTGGMAESAKDIPMKILWVKNNRPEIFKQAKKFISPETYLINKTTDNKSNVEFPCPYDECVLYWCFDNRRGKFHWDKGLAEKTLKLNIDLFPDPVACTENVGTVGPKASKELGIPVGIPVIAGGGDAAAAMVGSGSVLPGEVNFFIGTSMVITALSPERKLNISNRIGPLNSPMCTRENPSYMLIAEQVSAGACYEWLYEQIGGLGGLCAEKEIEKTLSYADLDVLSSNSAPGSRGLLFNPWLFGERCPVSATDVRGGWLNLSLDNTLSDLVRSVMEGVAYHTRWIVDGLLPMIKKYRKQPSTVRGSENPPIRITGGGAQSKMWCQVYSDILNHPVEIPFEPQHAGAVGTALIAAVGDGYFKEWKDIKEMVTIEHRYYPNEKPEIRKMFEKGLVHFQSSYEKLKGLYHNMNREPSTRYRLTA